MFFCNQVKTLEILARDKVGIRLRRSKRPNIVWLSTHDLTDNQIFALLHLHGGDIRVEKHPVIFCSPEKMIEIVSHFSEDGSSVYVVPPWQYLKYYAKNPSILGNISFRRFKGRDISQNFFFSTVENRSYVTEGGKMILEERLLLGAGALLKMKQRSERIS